MILLKQVSKTFRTETGDIDAIRDISLRIADGSVFGIIGFSGAGKSTLVRCINLLEKPNSGSVYVDGLEMTALMPKELRKARKQIGMIFQHFNLMRNRTVFGNVAYPLWRSGLTKQEIACKVRVLLELVDIAEKENAYPSQLSGGQKQRVAIARALANDPKVLLCDEATSALDPQTTDSILQLLKKLNNQLGLTVVVITHEMAVIKEICDRVAVMENGRIVEEGEVCAIFSDSKEVVTRDFIRTTSNLHKVDALLASDDPVVKLKPGELMLRLSYKESNVSEPLISTVSHRFGVYLNIIFADIELVQGHIIGGTVAVLSGEQRQITQALDYLKEKNVGVEVLKDARTA
ncbi:MAG: ATP-binding cassette domain-containing protein [Clostridia bacterium]|nr:ATP-binding cassette domain-containing protein [Clostridia bacterium]